MFAARVDQENAVHQRQTAAAAKPLNQGIQGLASKALGNRIPKTPFKTALHDENEAGKTQGKGLGGKQPGGQAQRSLFQTPAPRERQALGFKTTNAKAGAFKTPAPKTLGPSPEKTQRKTVGRSRIQIHREVKDAEPEIDWANEEIQYIGPKPTPLPDVPSDDEWDKVDFSILKRPVQQPSIHNNELMRQFKEERDAEERKTRDEEWAKFLKDAEGLEARVLQEFLDSGSEDDAPARMVQKKKVTSSVGTVNARSAASVLAKQPRPSATPSYAAPTAATKARAPSSSVLGHKKSPSISEFGSAARVAPHSTLGYAKGRAVSSSIRQPLAGVFEEAQPTKPKKKNPIRELEEIVRVREFEAMGVREEDLDSLGSGGVSLDDEDEEVFQMTIPDNLE